MSFTINLYTFAKKQNSTLRPTGNGTAAIGEFKEITSLINPQIYIAPISGATIPTFNYCYIQQLARYYFITECTWENGRYLISLSVDVLATYKNEIGSSSQYVSRSSAASNGYITDSMYPRTTQVGTSNVILGTGRNQSLDNGYFVLGLVSPQSSVLGCVTYYVMNFAAIVRLREMLLSNVTWTNVDEISDELLQTLFNPFQYIVSFKWFPLAPPVQQLTNVTEIKFGYWTFSLQGVQNAFCALYVPTGLPATTGQKYSVNFSTTYNHPAIAKGRYLNGEGFADYYLLLTGYGKMKLPNDPFVQGVGITMYETVDFVSGDSILNVYLGSGTSETISPLLTAHSHMGFDLPFGSSDVDVLKAATGAVGSVTGAVTDFLLGNVTGGITSIAQGISDAAHELSPTVQVGGSSGSFAALAEFAGVDSIQCVFRAIVNEDNADLGRPLCEVRTISSIAGYIQCVHAHVPINGTLSEQQEVEQTLESGFYYE